MESAASKKVYKTGNLFEILVVFWQFSFFIAIKLETFIGV